MINRYTMLTPFEMKDPDGDFVKLSDVRALVEDAKNSAKAMRTRTDEVVLVALIQQLEATLKQIGGEA